MTPINLTHEEKDSLLLKLGQALMDVSCLMDASYGVAGLHQNGDVAPWEELLEGGRFEGWLASVSQALPDVDRIYSLAGIFNTVGYPDE